MEAIGDSVEKESEDTIDSLNGYDQRIEQAHSHSKAEGSSVPTNKEDIR